MLFYMAGLGDDDIRSFATHRGVGDAQELLDAIERGNLTALARRPFDLQDLLESWLEDHSLESRLHVLERSIARQLRVTTTKAFDALTEADALDAARILAGAVVMTGEANVRLVSTTSGAGLDAVSLLPKLSESAIEALLGSGIFTEPIHGAVRFRHREIRELLAARWLEDFLAEPRATPKLMPYLVRSYANERFISARLRSVVSWLLLFNEEVRRTALELSPEVAVEGGDPVQLPLEVRKVLLGRLVERVIDRSSPYHGMDNAAVARIANSDLENDVRALVEHHRSNDDAIFLLGRLVWQGKMTSCVSLLKPIAADPGRGIYARIVSARTVARIGGDATLESLWRSLVASAEPIPRRLLAEMLDNAGADLASVRHFLAAFEKVEPREEYSYTGLTRALHGFIDRLPVGSVDYQPEPLVEMAKGLRNLLAREPHIERRDCPVSEQNQRLIDPGLHCAERLIQARSEASFDPDVLAILAMAPIVGIFRNSDYDDRKSSVGELVPEWERLNDALFWATIAQRRVSAEAKGERLVDDWPVTWAGHFWTFDASSFERTLGWIRDMSSPDDRHVALARALRTFDENKRPKKWLDALRDATKDDQSLSESLALKLEPPKPSAAEDWNRQDRNYKRERRRRELRDERNRVAWIERLKADPDTIRRPKGLEPGQTSTWQYQLLRIVEGEELRTSRATGSDWRRLIPEFGEPVALAFRDAAMEHWRAFVPALRSEGSDTSTIPAALVFAMAGLDMEAGSLGTGLNQLPDVDLRHALRYLTKELNGFPRWLQPLYEARPEPVYASLWREILWELEASTPDEELHYVLHDLVYYAPWLKPKIAEQIFDWIAANGAPNVAALRHCRDIMVNGGIEPARLATTARKWIAHPATDARLLPHWFAIWMDTDPPTCFGDLESKLKANGEAPNFMSDFSLDLAGGRLDGVPRVGRYLAPTYLKDLYLLAHKYIRTEEDLRREGGGAYSVTRRDEAQDAREYFFNALAELRGQAAYAALQQLALSPPIPAYRFYMRARAKARATVEGEVPMWTEARVRGVETWLRPSGPSGGK